MKHLTLMFPDDSGIEIEVGFEIDKRFMSGVDIQEILLTGKKTYYFGEYLSDCALDMIEKRVVDTVLHA